MNSIESVSFVITVVTVVGDGELLTTELICLIGAKLLTMELAIANSNSFCQSFSFFSIDFRFNSLYLLYTRNSLTNEDSVSLFLWADLCLANLFFFLCKGFDSTIISSNSKQGSQFRWSSGGLNRGWVFLPVTFLKSIFRSNDVCVSSICELIRAPGWIFNSC